MSVKVGDKVLLPEYGGTKVVIEDQVCSLYFYFQLFFFFKFVCHSGRLHGDIFFHLSPQSCRKSSDLSDKN